MASTGERCTHLCVIDQAALAKFGERLHLVAGSLAASLQPRLTGVLAADHACGGGRDPLTARDLRLQGVQVLPGEARGRLPLASQRASVP